MTQPLNFTDYSDKKSVAGSIAGIWDTWNSARKTQLELWKEVDEYRFATKASDLGFDHTTHIPLLHEIDEDLGAILYATAFPHDDFLDFKPLGSNLGDIEVRKKVLGYLKHAHSLTDFTKLGKQTLNDVKVYGNCFAQTIFHKDDESTLQTEKSMLKSTTSSADNYSGFKTYRISPYDIVFNPTASSFKASPKIVRQLMTVGEFSIFCQKHSDLIDAELKKNILSRRTGTYGSGTHSDHYKNAQYTPDGFSNIETYYRSGMVELLWFYGAVYDEKSYDVHLDRTIVVVDRDKVLMDYQAPSRIQKGSWKERPDNLWAQGALEPIVGINYMVNHRENAKNDAIDRMINPDELYIGNPEIIHDTETGRREIWAPEGGGAQDITPDGSTLAFNTEIANHMEIGRRGARLPQQLAGFRTAGEKTAFEVQNLNDGAFRGFIDKVAQYEQDFLEKVITDQLEVARENVSSVIEVLDTDEEGINTFLQITPKDLKANGKLVPYGSRRFSRQLQQIAALDKATQLQPVIGSHVSSFALAKAFEELSGLNQFNIIGKNVAIDEQLEQQQAAMLAEQQMASMASEPTMQELALQDGEEDIPLG